MKLVSLAIMVCLFCVGCSSTGTVNSEQLKYTQWQLAKVDGLSVPASYRASMSFIEAMQVNGFAGCNKFFGEGELTDSMLTVSKLGKTRKSCGEQIDSFEQQLLDTLQQGALLKLEGETLQINGESTLTFIAKN